MGEEKKIRLEKNIESQAKLANAAMKDRYKKRTCITYTKYSSRFHATEIFEFKVL